MLKNIFIVLITLISCGCVSDEFKKNPTHQISSTELPFNGVCGEEYASTLKIHTELFGDNPTIVVFDKIPINK